MKNRILGTLALVCFTFFALDAQILEQNLSLGNGSNNAMILEIENVDAKMVSKIWKDYMEDNYDVKTKFVKKEGHWFSDDAKIPALGGTSTVDVYGKAEQEGKNVKMVVWVDLGQAYLASFTHPDTYVEGEKMMYRFGQDVDREKTKLELKAEEKALKEIQNELKKLVVVNERYHKDIERAQEAIKKAEAEIEQNLKAQEATNLKIESQEKVIKTVQQKLGKF